MMRAVVAGAALAAVAAGAIAATRPDPTTEAVEDGCRRERAGLYTQEVPNWASVGDRNYPASGPPPPLQSGSGVVDSFAPKFYGAHPTPIDNPRSHDSYDFVFDLKLDPQSDFLLGAGNLARGEEEGQEAGEEQEERASLGRLHTERESGTFPTFAWPTVGDRVIVRGYWVWDCDHVEMGEKTEIHPVQSIWIPRRVSPRSPTGEAEGALLITNLKTEAGAIADCAHRTKGDRGAYKACLRTEDPFRDVSGTYSYRLPLPPRPSRRARLRLRVVDAGSTGNAPPVVVLPGTTDATVTVQVPPSSTRLVVAKRVLAGWTPQPARPVHLRVRLESLLIRRAMDPGCGPQSSPTCLSRESTRDGQATTPPGEWNVYWDVGGIWGQWRPLVLRVRDGQRVRGRQAVDLFVRRGRPWRLYVFARECDFGTLSADDPSEPVWPCPRSAETGAAAGDDAAGSAVRVFPSPEASLGRHTVDARLETSSCPRANRRGCYSVTIVVRRVRERAGG